MIGQKFSKLTILEELHERTIKQRYHLGYTDKECLFGRDK